jgi:ribonucleoside-diphosphate reductase alpha chain
MYQKHRMVPDLFVKSLSAEPVKTEPAEPLHINKQNLVGSCPQCPECGEMLEFGEGCVVCRSCGYSKCS